MRDDKNPSIACSFVSPARAKKCHATRSTSNLPSQRTWVVIVVLSLSLVAVAICGTIVFFGIAIAYSPDEHSSSTTIETYHLPPPLSASLTSSSSIAKKSDVAWGQSHNRRRLSEALPNGGCKITWPQKPDPGTQVTYAASYPGCGARMTWNLVEALTGLQTGDDWNNNGRGEEVVTVKTHYPQSNGILVDFDERITRAFIIVRNPFKSIPSFFNHIYEIRNHLPVHSERAPVEEWIKWRNAYLDTEIAEYKKFICYWMDRYTAENRLLITYEGLTDDLIGAEVTKGLNDFLGRAEGVTVIDRESVPCIWRAVVKNEPPPEQKAQIEKLQALAVNQPQGHPPVSQAPQQQETPQSQEPQQQAPQSQEPQQQAPQQQEPQPQPFQPQLAGEQPADPAAQATPLDVQLQNAQQQLREAQALMQNMAQQQPQQPQGSDSQQTGLRRRLDPGHHNSQRQGPPVARPYAPEQLDKMMGMLLEVAEQYHKEDVRLYHIMMGYYEMIREERRKLDPEAAVNVKPPGGFF